jgi:hypothetical protein
LVISLILNFHVIMVNVPALHLKNSVQSHKQSAQTKQQQEERWWRTATCTSDGAGSLF